MRPNGLKTIGLPGAWRLYASTRTCPTAMTSAGRANPAKCRSWAYFAVSATACACTGAARKPKPHHKTTTDFFSDMNAEHNRYAIRCQHARQPSHRTRSVTRPIRPGGRGDAGTSFDT
jgi:hypothetical protein